MKTKVVLLLAVFLPLAARAADEPGTLLQKGLFEEEANQNLPAAIKAYESLLAASDEQRKLAATALFRLGECYRKLGKTNDAVAQYQRLLRDYADQPALVVLSRQNLRGLGVAAEKPGTDPDDRAGSIPSGEARERLRELLTNELQLAEQFAAEQRKKIEAGILASGEEVRFERDVLGLKRQLVAVDGLTSAKDRREWRDLLLQEIALAEKAVRLERQKLESGKSVASEVARLQRDVLILKRELVAFESGMVLSEAAAQPGLPDTATLAEGTRAEVLVKQLQALNREELRRTLPTVAPDQLLSSLLERLAEFERNLAQQRNAFADDHPTVKGWKVSIEVILRQIDDRIDGIMRGLSIKAEALKRQAGQIGSNSNAADVAPTDEEEKEIRRIQALIRNSPDLINAAGQDWTPLHQAAIKGQLVVARYLLENGANVNQMTSDNSGPALLLAASRGHRSMVELLLAKGANPNVKDQRGTTALHEAAAKGFASVVDVLLASKAEVDLRNSSGETPLHLAVNGAQTSVIELLLKRGADINAQSANGWTPLHFAATRGDADTIAVLLQNKADVNVKDRSDVPPLAEALTRSAGTAEAVRVLLENGARTDFTVNGDSPVQCAVARNSVEMVRLLLQHKAAPDLRKRNGCTPLQSVVVDGRKAELIPILVKAGANPNALLPESATATVRDPSIGSTSSRSVSRHPILSVAIARRDLPQVEALLANGADVDAVVPDGSYQTTVLMFAVFSGSQELMDAVLRYKPDLELRTKVDGRTALHWAADQRSMKAVESLIKAGAKVDAADHSGWTPLHLAAHNGNTEIAKALLEAGANPNVHALDGALPLSIARRTSAQTVLSEETRQEISRLLLQHGADESLLRRRAITVTRRGRNFERIVFRKGTNDFNRHSLYELMARLYQQNGSDKEKTAFPDLRRIAIERVDGKSGTRQIFVDLEARAAGSACTNDFWLEWGDLVEIRETEHPISASWPGLDGTIATNISRCLERSVELVIKGRINRIELHASVHMDPPRLIDGRFVPGGQISHEPFRLAEVLQRSGLLLTSSDLSRVKVSRRDSQTGQHQEWIVNAVNPNSETDLWLRDGDVVEVPEKDPNAPRTAVPSAVPQPGGFRAIPPRTQRPLPGQ